MFEYGFAAIIKLGSEILNDTSFCKVACPSNYRQFGRKLKLHLEQTTIQAMVLVQK
jgi:hypothetical protein